jgi:hypothetical protein
MQIRGDFLGFLKYFSGQSNIGEISRLSLMNNASCSLRQSQAQFCQFFGMNGAIFLRVWQGCLWVELCPYILVICTRKRDKSHESQ